MPCSLKEWCKYVYALILMLNLVLSAVDLSCIRALVHVQSTHALQYLSDMWNYIHAEAKILLPISIHPFRMFGMLSWYALLCVPIIEWTQFLSWLGLMQIYQRIKHQPPCLHTSFLSVTVTQKHVIFFFDLLPDFHLPVHPTHLISSLLLPLNLERGQSRSRGRKQHKHGLEVRFPSFTEPPKPLVK